MMERIIVAHEGKFWIEPDGMVYYPEFNSYEQVHEGLGKGPSFINKKYSNEMKRSLFEYALSSYYINKRRSFFEYALPYPAPYILAVPATGEEISFAIFGVDRDGVEELLFAMEL